ncbi:hypothetical protein PO909_003837, partial [Leuciscus waleckii]
YPERGDLIEIFRPFAYQHWAVYVGDGYVIHLTSVCKSTVKREKLKDVVGEDKYRFNNLLDDDYDPRPIKDIVKEAQSLVGERHPYNVIYSNCEHFATMLRYGKPLSLQVGAAVVRAVVPQPVRSVWN